MKPGEGGISVNGELGHGAKNGTPGAARGLKFRPGESRDLGDIVVK